MVSVIDDGVGMTDQQMIAINAGEQPQAAAATAAAVAGTDAATVDPLAGTGLGLCIVRQSVHALGGTLQASQAPDGGAALSHLLSREAALRCRAALPSNSPGCLGRRSGAMGS